MDLSFHPDFYGSGEREQQHPQHYQIPYHITSQQLPFVVDQTEVQRRREEHHQTTIPSVHTGTGPLRSLSNPTCQPASEPSFTYTPSIQHITTLQPSSQSSSLSASTTAQPSAFPRPLAPTSSDPAPTAASHHEKDSGHASSLHPATSFTTKRPVLSHRSAGQATAVTPARNSTVLPRTSNLHKDLIKMSKALKSRKSKSRDDPGSDLPDFLRFKFSPDDKENIAGVVASGVVEKDALFGPYDGNLLDEDGGSHRDSSWELCLHGTVFLYIDGKRKGRSHMMSHIQCARNQCGQNLEAIQSNGDIYFRATKAIEPGEELKVFYGEMYSDLVGFKTKLDDLNYLEDENKFECKICYTKLPSSKQMIRHIRFDHETDASKEVLPIVTWMVNTPNEIETPAKKPAERDESEDHVCWVCGKEFPSRGRLEAHAMFHEFTEELTCPVCGESQSNALVLKKHMGLHGKKTHKCSKCDKAYMRRSGLYKHERDAHGPKVKRIPEAGDTKEKEGGGDVSDDDIGKDQDQVCENIENAEMAIDTSVNTSSNDKRTTFCDKEKILNVADKSRDKISSALWQKKKAKTQPDEPRDMLGKAVDYYMKPRPFKCRYCPKRYVEKWVVIAHEKEVHLGKGNYKCDDCGRQFLSETHFLEHLNSHQQRRLFPCAHCPRSFASEVALTNHQGEHTGLKPFKCEICGRGFGKKKCVSEHKRRMHQNRPLRFFCSFCEKGFCDKAPLVKHERRHRGIRPFVCLQCGKGFTSKYSMQTHTRAMHEEKRPYKCHICAKTFTMNHSFTSHMFRHQLQGQEISQNTE